MMNQIRYLDWDSNLFGYAVAKVVISENQKIDLDKIFSDLQFHNIKLCYFFIKSDDNKTVNSLTKKGVKLFDTRLSFSRSTAPISPINKNIELYLSKNLTSDLQNLALQTGEHSRFNVDPNFQDNEYEKLYIKWLENSIKNPNEVKTFIIRDGQKIIAFLTLRLNKIDLSIELMSVDKTHRGKHLGSDLVNFAINFAYEAGFNSIRVVTQKENRIACELYKKHQFTELEALSIYHFWQ